MMVQEEEEWLPLVSENGSITGKELRSVCHSDKKYLHPVVHLHVFNRKGELFLQKRPLFKKVQPGKWDTAVGGHVAWGEDVTTSLQREAQEEIGISSYIPKEIKTYIWESDIEREYVHCFITEYNDVISFNKQEIADGSFWSRDDIEENLAKGCYTPNFEHEYINILSTLKKK